MSLNDSLLQRELSLKTSAAPIGLEISISTAPQGVLGQIDDTQQNITNNLVGLRMELERLENLINIKR